MTMKGRGRGGVDCDTLLLELRADTILIISEDELWPSDRVTCARQRSFRRHRCKIRHKIARSEVSVCPSPTWHRKFYYYRDRCFICGACEILLKEVTRQ